MLNKTRYIKFNEGIKGINVENLVKTQLEQILTNLKLAVAL